jgi:hypothetical protein
VIETRAFPSLARRYPRDFTFYVADPAAPFAVAIWLAKSLTREPGGSWNLAFICQSRREGVAAPEHDLIGPSSQIFRESYLQSRLIAVEPPGNWRAALELRTDFGSRPGATNG